MKYRKRTNRKLKSKLGITGAIVVAGLGFLKANPQIISSVTGTFEDTPAQSQQITKSENAGSVSSKTPSQSLAETVLTPQVTKDLKYAVTYNGTGAFIVNDNKTDLNAKVNSAPYVQLSKQDGLGRVGVANALLNKSSRQYKDRSETTSNGKSNSAKINPVGWHQVMLKGGSYSTLYNRGHSIGYALAGNIKGFDSSEANPQNISTQTAWANQASGVSNTGQNYYEGLVRKALDANKTVRYRVEPLYEGNNLVPSGTHIEAKSKDGQLEFNVFVPNVQAGVSIDYATGKSVVNK